MRVGDEGRHSRGRVIESGAAGESQTHRAAGGEAAQNAEIRAAIRGVWRIYECCFETKDNGIWLGARRRCDDPGRHGPVGDEEAEEAGAGPGGCSPTRGSSGTG